MTATNAWQPGSNGTNGSHRTQALRTSDGPWSSAGAALEPSLEPATNGWRRAATSGLRGRAEVRTRYADLLAPVSPALPPQGQADEIPQSAPPFPYEGDLPPEPNRGWAPPRTTDRPPLAPVPPPPAPEFDPFRPSSALTDPTYDDLPALAKQAAAASHAAAAARAASAGVAAAEARVARDDRAAVQAAFQSAQGGTAAPPGPYQAYQPPAAPPRPPDHRPGDHRPGDSRPAPPHPADHRPAPAEHRPVNGNHAPSAAGVAIPMPAAYLQPPGPARQVPPPAGPPRPVEQSRRAEQPAARPMSPAAPPAPASIPRTVAAPAPGPFAEPPVVWPAPVQAPNAPVSSAPVSAAPVSSAPVSSVPTSAVPTSAVPVSATPVSTHPLPQRVPALPDVPELFEDESEEDPYVEPGGPLPTADLARTASRLRYNAFQEQAAPPPEGFDFDAVLVAVRKVPGVRDAALKPNPAGVATLRLDLDEGADAAMVSRLVARLLKQKMGLAAEPRKPPAPPRLPPQPGGPPPEPATGDDRTRRHPVTPVRTREDGEHRRSGRAGGIRVALDQVQVSTLGMDATVEVRLLTGAASPAIGVASGPAVDGYILRLAAMAATSAIDQILSRVTGDQHGRSFVEHAAVVPFGSCEVAVTVVLLAYGGTVEQLTGSALVAGDPRQAVVRATLAAVNRRLDALLG